MAGIPVPAEPAHAQFTVKGSKFIAAVIPVSDEEEAKAQLTAIRKKYHDATHNCYAWRIHSISEKASDDGEPSGSAGKPILQVLKGSDLTNALVIVTRYFGGTKLGIGGLVRAYSEAASMALRETKVVTLYPLLVLSCAVSFQESQSVYQAVSRFPDVKISGEEYDGNGAIFSLRMKEKNLEPFREQLQEYLNREPGLVVVEEILDQI
ncbi:MAG: YigZ family protein [Acidobacteria bacterium CG_4_9_14_3_um_filter_49_7]|nr:MAG: YigZ family protein [Acidobacteria bacterium CG_4_9_14_3_um_filter_49_7]